MQIDSGMTDDAVIAALGARLAGLRLERNLTQAELAEQAGISKRTVERLETGEVALQFSSFIRICRVLGLLERLDALLPEPAPGPIAQLERQGGERKRASRRRKRGRAAGPWTWGEP